MEKKNPVATAPGSDKNVIRSSIHTTRALLAEIGGRNMRPNLAWNVALCPDGGFMGYQPKSSELDRSEQKI